VRRLPLLSITVGCSLHLGTPSTHGWPSGNPDAYKYQQSYNCHVYEKTVMVDTLAVIVGSAIAATGLLMREGGHESGQTVTIGAGAVTAPFLLSWMIGQLGRSRCQRWAEEMPLYAGPAVTAGSAAPL
jgi:hypothetical protein